ncbi:MAG: entericidin A/B family lipoprotein [Phycisphaerales bacterium]
MFRFVRAFTVLILLLGGCWALTGCNTVEGVGEDIEAGGRAISGASRDVRN